MVIETSAGGLPDRPRRAPLAARAWTDGRRSCSARLRSRRGRRSRTTCGSASTSGRRRAARPGPTILRDAAIVVPSPDGLARLRVEAAAAGCAVVEPPGVDEQPELAAAALLRFAEDPDARRRDADARRASVAGASFEDGRRRARARLPGSAGVADERRGGETEPLADRDWIVVDLHMHTRWSHDCSIEPAALVDHAESEGLGAIAVTDHNVFGGALETVELARGRELIVIPGEEVKTDRDGEVIGLFLREEIPRGMSFADTVAAIREQEGVVYVPHPFDRMHSIPAPATLHRHLPEIDVLEVYNARLLFDALQRRGAPVRAQVRAAPGRRLGRPRAPGGRDGRAPDAALRRAGGVPPLAAHRGGAAPAEVARAPPVAQVGRAGARSASRASTRS